MKKDIRYQKEVLIETYWNVKDIADLLVVNLTSINRNILECKGRKDRAGHRAAGQY